MLSRWRVGGQSTLDVVREFVQELPHTAAGEAWQRSVQLAMETPVDPESELRVKAGREAVELTAKHPFFWAGYLVVDSGWRPDEEEADGAEQGAEPPAAVPPVAPAGAGAPGGAAAGAPPADPAPARPVPPEPAPGAADPPGDPPP
jgi:hypothetical protein